MRIAPVYTRRSAYLQIFAYCGLFNLHEFSTNIHYEKKHLFLDFFFVLCWFLDNVSLNQIVLDLSIWKISPTQIFVWVYWRSISHWEQSFCEMFEILRRNRAEAVACGLCGMSDWVKTTLDAVLPMDIVARIRGRFSVGFTKYPCGTLIFQHEFESRDDLINAVVSSCTTPPFSIGPRCYRGNCT